METYYYFLYKSINNINGKIYIGVHQTNDLNDEYMGSGQAIKDAIRKYGKENFSREILYRFKNSDSMYFCEEIIVNQEFINQKNTYNLNLGGYGGWQKAGIPLATGKVVVNDKNGNTFQVSINDPRYLNGDLIHINKGKSVAIDKDGNIFQVSVNDLRWNTGEIQHIKKGKKHKLVKCPYCNEFVPNGSIAHFDYCKFNPNKKGKKPREDKIIICPWCDTKGTSSMMHRYHFNYCPNNPNASLLKIKERRKFNQKECICPWCNTKGAGVKMYVYHFEYCDKNPNRIFIYRKKESKPRTLKLLTCPHCGKEGKGGNMTRWHFNNCKLLIKK